MILPPGHTENNFASLSKTLRKHLMCLALNVAQILCHSHAMDVNIK